MFDRLDELIEVVKSWLEMKGHESGIDNVTNSIYYEDDDGRYKKFCSIDEKSLLNKIEYHNMDELEIIE